MNKGLRLLVYRMEGVALIRNGIDDLMNKGLRRPEPAGISIPAKERNR